MPILVGSGDSPAVNPLNALHQSLITTAVSTNVIPAFPCLLYRGNRRALCDDAMTGRGV